MSRLPLVIVNPASRGGSAARDWPSAACALRSHFGPFECRFTESRGHAAAIAREEAERGRTLLVTFGGDGTISETARGILASGRDVALGILPHGTGGDLARSLGVPSRLPDAARRLRETRSVRIDVGKAVFANGVETRFLNSASFGLSAEVARRVNRGEGGRARYATETVKAALQFPFPEVEIRSEGGPPRRLRITTVSLHNGRFFGGGMKMAPEASLTDGLLDAVVVRKLSPGRLLGKSPRLYLGAHLALPEVEHRKLERLEARPVAPGVSIPVEIDGESEHGLPARFEVLPRALRVRLGGPW